MTVQQHDRGEEYTIKVEAGFLTRASQITFGLFQDGGTGGDNLSDSDDISAITTEPTSGNYTRQTFSLDSTEFTVTKNANGNYQYTKDSFDWDVGGTTESVDSWFAIINFNGDGDSTATDHLVFSGSLDQTRDLSNSDTLTVSSIGRIQD